MASQMQWPPVVASGGNAVPDAGFYRGASTIVTWRPSKFGSISTFAMLGHVGPDPIEHPQAELLMRHLAAAEAQA